MKKYIPLVLMLAVVVVVFCAQNVAAQSGTCPDWTSGVSPNPPGNWPASMAMCASSGEAHRVTTVFGSAYPCGGGLQVDAWDPTNQGQATMYLVTPSSQTFPSSQARIRWQMSAERWAVSQYEIEVTVKSFDDDNHQIGNKVLVMESFPMVISQIGQEVYTIETVVSFVSNGYATVEVTDPVGPFYAYDVFYFGFKVMDANQWPPLDYCQVDGQLPPTITPTPSQEPTPTREPTNTPTPSNTPTGTPPNTPTPSNTPDNTPTRTPSPTPQTYPTSPGGTSSPFPTSTLPHVPTVAAPSTPTRLPIVNMPTLALATISLPGVSDFGTPAPFADIGLTPNGTSAAQATSISGWGDDGFAMVTRWYTTTGFASGSFSTTVTGTTGISSAVEIADTLVTSVASPFYYAKLIKTYLPNLWPLVLFLILAVGWIFFNLVAKYGMSIIGNLVELIRRLIELIPGF